MSSRVTVLTASLAGVVGGAVIGGSLWMGAAADPASDAEEGDVPDASTADCHPHGLGRLGAALPEELRPDLEALRDLAPEERREAMEDLRDKALAGEYGEEAQEFAERRAERRDRWAEKVPEELRADLEKVKELAPEERRAALEELREKALAGEYGEEAQELAERRAERRERWAEKVPDGLREDLRGFWGMDPQERRSALGDLRDKALAGEYGDRARRFAEHREHRQQCGTGGRSEDQQRGQGDQQEDLQEDLQEDRAQDSVWDQT